MPFLGGCAHALSLLRQDHPAPTPCPMPYDMPLWHNLLFRNMHNQTYFCPRRIRDGVVTWGEFLEDDSSQSHVAPMWRPIYNVSAPMDTKGNPELPNH